MKLKSMWLAFAIALMIAVPLRTYQLLYLVDPANGFAVAGEITFTLLFLFLVLFVLFLIVLGLMGKHSESVYQPGANRLTAVICFLTALFTAFYSFCLLFPEEEKVKWEFALIAGFGFASIAYFLLLSLGEFKEKNPFSRYKLLALLPTLWIITRLTVTFVHYTTVANYNVSLFDIFTEVFLLLFFHDYGKLLANIKGKRLLGKIYSFGMAAAVIALLNSIPPMVSAIYYGSLTLQGAASYIMNIVLAAFVICTLFQLPTRVGDSAEIKVPELYPKRDDMDDTVIVLKAPLAEKTEKTDPAGKSEEENV